MFDLIGSALVFALYGNTFGLANVAIGSVDILIDYIATIIVAVVAALILRVPMLPDKPYRYSFDVSAIYPTPIIAAGIFSIFLVLNYTFMYNGLVLAVIIGVLSALFVKYLFDFVFPKPLNEDNGEDVE